MKLKQSKPLLCGVAAVAASILTLSSSAYGVCKSPLALGWVDGYFGIETRDIFEDREFYGVQHYKKDHANLASYADALKDHAIRQGEEGFALLKNDNSALPLASAQKVALFGWNCYNLPNGHTGVVAGNKGANAYHEQITLATALDARAEKSIVADDFPGKMAKAAYGNYTIGETFEEKSTWTIDKASTTAIVTVGRGGGEGANYKVDDKTTPGASDPLALSAEEIEMIDYAKAHCSKVVVLVVSANAMELAPIAKGGAHEVDAIGFCGIPNDYQYKGIANVLEGKANASGALTDTYVVDNSYTPASINMGEQNYVGTTVTEKEVTGWNGTSIQKFYSNPDIDFASVEEDPFHRDNGGPLNASDLCAANYIVEAEGIYVGYKYYETRYFDSIANPSSNATATAGSSTGTAWDYNKEVLYTFGHGLSYIPYTQEVTNVSVDVSENGQTTATIKITNNGTQDGKFLGQLYVSRPYTQYDKDNKIEKSAVDFMNSKKVTVAAGQSKEVEVSFPTRYLASWDSNGAKTYVLDEGDYLFTAASGAHEAVNNILASQGKTTDNTTNGSGVKKVNQAKLDTTTYSMSNGYKVTNVADNVDINYYLPNKVTYLSRSNWRDTFPKNYTNYVNDSGIASEAQFNISDSPKKAEWQRELRNLEYVPETNNPETNLEGILPDDVGEGKQFATAWDWITSFKLSDPEAFDDVNSDIWNQYAQAIGVNEAVGAILHGGNTTDSLAVGNPTSAQSESVSGYQQTLTIIPATSEEAKDAKTMKLNVASNTLLGASFSPDLAYEWGQIEGEGGLWLQDEKKTGPMTVWGAGLNLHRHAYNGRNSEYMSEDPMLSNRIGEQQIKGAMEKGAIVGPKHMGFNDQELNRQGNACYMTEQKMRETDIRCYEGALRKDEGNGNGIMMSFARVGATNVTNHVGLNVEIMRNEWGFSGISTTDMGQKYYHEPYAIINARICQYAGFGANDSFIGENGQDYKDTAADKTWSYVTMATLKNDHNLCEAAREANKYQQYVLAHSANVNIRNAKEGETGEKMTLNVFVGQIKKAPWENIFIGLNVAAGIVTGLAGAAWIALNVLPAFKKED